MPVGLAPNPRSKFRHHVIRDADMEGAPLFPLPFHQNVDLRGYTVIDEPTCQIIIEDFMPGTTIEWVFTHDEYQYGISGMADIEVFEPPLYQESSKARLEAGSVYTFPVGARMKITVVGDQPYRHICFCPPSPGYPFPTVDDVRAQMK